MKFSPLIVANWKMNLIKRGEEYALAETYHASFSLLKGVLGKAQVVICPSFLSLSEIGAHLDVSKTSCVRLGAQDCAWEEKGAYTGEVSPVALESQGVSYIILGHSERRIKIGESGVAIRAKLEAIYCTTRAITPILCVGEDATTRKAGKTSSVLRAQISEACKGLSVPLKRRLVIAYEPVWAIGTGDVITPEACAEVYAILHKELVKLLPDTSFSILYGGSVSANNAQMLVAPGVSDGVLVGGASLDRKEFVALVKSIIAA